MRQKYDKRLIFLVLILIIIGPGEAFVSGGLSGLSAWLTDMLLVIPGIIVGLSFHEFAHAKVAVLCGDNTPLFQGRVTLDPRAHIDPMGFIALIFIHFGWGKPVMIYPYNFKNIRRDSLLVGVAGVAMNLIIAVVFGFIIKILTAFVPEFFTTKLGWATGYILVEVVITNVMLMLFNLLPIPPLDGFGIVCDIFNLRGSAFQNFMIRNSSLILILMILFDIPNMILSTPLLNVVNFIMTKICMVPYWWMLL